MPWPSGSATRYRCRSMQRFVPPRAYRPQSEAARGQLVVRQSISVGFGTHGRAPPRPLQVFVEEEVDGALLLQLDAHSLSEVEAHIHMSSHSPAYTFSSHAFDAFDNC